MSVSKGEITNIAEMIDMAIGCPEIGVVDFNMLSAVLHCLAQQVGVRDKNVELRGQLSPFKDPIHTIAVTEFVYETDAAEKEIMTTGPTPQAENTILVVERVTRDYDKQAGAEDTSDDHGAMKKATKPQIKSPSEGRAVRSPTIVRESQDVQHGKDGKDGKEATESKDERRSSVKADSDAGASPTSRAENVDSAARLSGKLSLVTMSKFNMLEGVVSDLKDRVYGSLPKNEDLLQEVRSQTNLKAITDMWTSLNVSSRLEAAEAGLSKLSSLLQDLINDPNKLEQLQITSELLAKEGPGAAPVDMKQIKETITYLQADVSNLTNMFNKAMDSLRSANIEGMPEKLVCTTAEAMDVATGADSVGGAGGVSGSGTAGADDGSAGTLVMTPEEGARTSVDADHQGQMSSTVSKGGESGRSRVGGDHPDIAAIVDRIISLEKQLRICCEDTSKKDGTLRDQIASLQDQVEGLQKSLAETQASGMPPEMLKNIDNLMAMCATVNNLQDQLKEVHAAAKEINAERQARQHSTNALLEQIELLKTIKLDREDMEEAMADKVNMQMLTRKVSREQFEMACNDLAKGLEITLGKLNNQEALWQQALDDIQREIETKLDKMELSPVKDFFSNKLKKLQENLKQMASLRHDIQAAGTKKKLLRDVKCLSCDQDAVMATEAQVSGGSRSMPPNMSMKPYLTYELDTIRKQQASMVPTRNMHDWETIDKQMSHPKVGRARSATDKHLCNRYCGGSHTVTTPAQRVARVGHFMKQWGPDVVPMSSGMAAGDDGKYYKVAVAEREKVGPGGPREQPPPPPSAKAESKASERGPILAHEECRCLEADRKG